YASAGALAEDLERFIDGRTILARRATLFERFHRWCRRNPWAASFFLVLLFGLCATTLLAIKASRAAATSRMERGRARDEAENAGAIEAFLSKDVLAKASASNQASATETPKADLKLREALDNAAGKIGDRFRGKPKIEGSIRLVIGETYLGL